VLFLLLGLLGMGLYGQKVKLSGVVRDSVTQELLPLVGVVLDGTTYGVNTNLDGEFLIVVPPGKYRLVVRAPGYKPYADSVWVQGEGAVANVEMQPVSMSLADVLITSKAVNPAHRVIRNAIAQRRKNKFDKIDAYEYESYNKLVLTMDNVTDRFLNSKLVRGVGKQVQDILGDSLHNDSSKYKIAGFVSESVSKFYYLKPDHKKEEILAVQTSGVKGSEYNLLSSMFLQIDMYDNNVVVVDRTFLSPIAEGAFVDYDYQLISIESYGQDTLYGIQVIPKRPFDPVFKGTVYIDNHDWALNRLDLALNDNPNINFVEDIRIRQEYGKVDTFWVPTLLDIEVDFQNSVMKRKGGEGIGVIGRSSAYLYNYVINQPREPKFYQQELVEVMRDADFKDSTYWAEMRKSPLDKSEQLGFALVDSLKSRGVLDFYINATRLVVWGTYKLPKWEFGPYFYLLSFDQAEGWRTRCGAYTRPEFSKHFYFGGHLAYGFGDHRLKYQVEGRYRIVRKPKLELGIKRTHEVEQVGFENFLNNGTSLLQSSLRRVPLTQLNYYTENRVGLTGDIAKGLSGEVYFRTKAFEPSKIFPFAYHLPDGSLASNYAFTEAGLDLRVSFKEKYIVSAQGDRTYIGTKYPVFYLKYHRGISNLLGGQFDYDMAEVNMRNFVRLGRYGWFRYDLRAGQVFGTVPYPSLHVFRGNMSWGYDRYGFNLMNYYEFVADRYLTFAGEQHFEGLLWNQLPLLRKLKWKEVLTCRVAWGSLTAQNQAFNQANILRIDGTTFHQQIKAPTRVPYLEAGAGLYNIFKVLRVDAIWRLNYHDLSFKTDSNLVKQNWGRFNNFGLRADFSITF
jgi:Family of unknown function (DUF5686)/CarboxypepD_reg-like domain